MREREIEMIDRATCPGATVGAGALTVTCNVWGRVREEENERERKKRKRGGKLNREVWRNI